MHTPIVAETHRKKGNGRKEKADRAEGTCPRCALKKKKPDKLTLFPHDKLLKVITREWDRHLLYGTSEALTN